MDGAAVRKARGAFFTPPPLAEFIARWALRTSKDRVLEPSCGDAGFLLPAARRLRSLGTDAQRFPAQLHGVEIHDASAEAAAQRLADAGFGAAIRVANFFDAEPTPIFDAVIGNPPYVRYQEFSGAARAKGLQAALAQGVRLTGLASSWAAFTIHAAQFLTADGRLGLVLPAELLSVNYAAQVRSFLLRRFRSVRLVLFDERVFPDVLEEVVLLLAEGSGGAQHFEVCQARNLNDLERLDTAAWAGFRPDGDAAKWTPALLPAAAFEAYRTLTEGEGFSTLFEWGDTYLGAVTGNNDYFTLTRAQAAELGLEPSELLRISPPGSKHLHGLTFSERAWEQLATEGKRCYLFAPSIKHPSEAALRYIAKGELAKVHIAYKCAHRKPWWRVPLVERPDLLFTYMKHDRPRITTNAARVQLLNSIYGVRLRGAGRDLGREILPTACLNSATLLGAEMVGRAYGGGMLKHEPKEADVLPVPSLATLEPVADELRALQPQLAGALDASDITHAIDLVDRIILERHLGLDRAAIDSLRQARDLLFQRRVARARG